MDSEPGHPKSHNMASVLRLASFEKGACHVGGSPLRLEPPKGCNAALKTSGRNTKTGVPQNDASLRMVGLWVPCQTVREYIIDGCILILLIIFFGGGVQVKGSCPNEGNKEEEMQTKLVLLAGSGSLHVGGLNHSGMLPFSPPVPAHQPVNQPTNKPTDHPTASCHSC